MGREGQVNASRAWREGTDQTWNIRKPRLWPGTHSANVRNSCFPSRQSSLCRTEHPPWTPGTATLPRLPGSRQFRDAQPQGPSPKFCHTLPSPAPSFALSQAVLFPPGCWVVSPVTPLLSLLSVQLNQCHPGGPQHHGTGEDAAGHPRVENLPTPTL